MCVIAAFNERPMPACVLSRHLTSALCRRVCYRGVKRALYARVCVVAAFNERPMLARVCCRGIERALYARACVVAVFN